MEMRKILGENFTFIATEPFAAQKVTAGFTDINCQYDFCLPSYLNSQNEEQALELCNSSDVMIIGSAPESYFRKRMRTGKLTFRYSERAFKPRFNSKFNPIVLACMWKGNTIYNRNPLYMLCASAYTASDYAFVGAYKNKAFKWGYFPTGSTKLQDELSEIKNQHETPEILWAGRMLDWKRPELAVETAVWLKNKGIDFRLTMVGDGPQKQLLEQLRNKYGLQGKVRLLSSVPN